MDLALRRAPMRTRYALLLILCFAPLAHANDFPTRARVEFVLTCMRESKAPQQEAMYKCSWALVVGLFGPAHGEPVASAVRRWYHHYLFRVDPARSFNCHMPRLPLRATS